MLRSIGLPEMLLPLFVLAAISAVIVIPFWRIFGKAGLGKELSLLMFIPFINVIALYYLAFAGWPSLGDQK